MAYPEKMTLTCGRTEYRGSADGSGNDEGITSRKVEVSVTYRLERRDVDLLHVVSVAARELDAAQEVLWQEAQGGTEETTDAGSGGQAELPLGENADAGEALTDADVPPDAPSDADDPLASYDYGADVDEDMDGGMEGSPFEEDAPDDEPPGHTGGSNGHWMLPSGSNPCQTAVGSTPEESKSGRDAAPSDGMGNRPVPVTKPQKLALAAVARRLGLSDVALSQLIKERFGKESVTPRYAVERLTKKEADTLLRVLAEREWATLRPERSVPA